MLWLPWRATNDVYGPVSLHRHSVLSLITKHTNISHSRPYNDFPYIQLRLISVLMGSLQVPIAYLTLKLMGHKSLTALVAASLFIFETGSITQHRHILTAAPLGFFAASSAMMWINFHNHQNR